jgi:hypothetical protein
LVEPSFAAAAAARGTLLSIFGGLIGRKADPWSDDPGVIAMNGFPPGSRRRL